MSQRLAGAMPPLQMRQEQVCELCQSRAGQSLENPRPEVPQPEVPRREIPQLEVRRLEVRRLEVPRLEVRRLEAPQQGVAYWEALLVEAHHPIRFQLEEFCSLWGKSLGLMGLYDSENPRQDSERWAPGSWPRSL